MSIYHHKTFQLHGALTNEQKDFFNNYGVLHFKNFIDRERVQSFIGELEKIHQKLVDNEVTKVNGVPLKYGHDSQGNRIIQRLAFTSHYSDVFSTFLKDERFTYLLPLLGNY